MKLAKGGDDITYDKLIIATGSTVSLLIFIAPCWPDACICACCNLQTLQRSPASYACTQVCMCWDLSSMYFIALMARPARVASKADRPQALLLGPWVPIGTNLNMA